VPVRQPPFRRSGPRFLAQPTVLVICEDSKSSRYYLDDVKRHFRAQLQLTVTHCGKTDPAGIVTEAVRRAKRFDHVYCVIDRDEHTNFDQAVQAVAQTPNVAVIASYPCFEYWFLLHFGYTRKPYARAGTRSPAECLIEDLKQRPGMADYAKGDKLSPFALLTLDQLIAARKHAMKSLQEAMEVNNLNPSTRVHELISVIEKLGAPIPIAEKGTQD
jgi:RloB-like protein